VDEALVMRYAEATDGVSLSYMTTGEGPTDLVWIAGLGYPVDLIAGEPGFLHLAKRLRTFTRTTWADPRGMGASGGNVLDVFNTHDGDITAILDAAESAKVVLVGWGHSGTPVIRYASAHPERVTALVLIDSYAHYRREPDYPVGPSADELRGRLDAARDLWGTGALLGVLAPSKSEDEQLGQRIARFERHGLSPDTIVEVTRGLCLEDVRELLPMLSVPTLVLHHEDGRFITPDAGRFLGNAIPRATFVELPGEDQLFFVGEIDALVDQIEEFLTGTHQGAEGDVVTKTILFTDIVSSTEQSARLGHRRWTALSDEHDAMVRATLAQYRGEEVKTIGDGFLAAFDATTRAVRAALEIVTAARNIGLEVRAGVHTGEVEVRPDDVVGLTVSIAKRICDLGGPGQVIVSEVVKGVLVGSGISTSDYGTHTLKGVPEKWRLFRVER
jgi:class 3 adenylate cyclase/pimeloyl-ACP methyl ester carboxylesterase